MKRLALFVFLLFGCDSEGIPKSVQAQSSVYAFENVNVVPMDEERILEEQTVLVAGDRITAVGPASSVQVPAEAVRIDGRGKYLMPGLAEMHGHIPSPSQSPEYTETVLFLFAANGVTTVRGMQGSPGQLDLKARVNAGELVGPNLYLAGPGFGGGSVDSPEQAREMVRRQKTEGWDLLKVFPGLTREEFDAMANEANELGIPFGGHVPEDVGLAHAMEMGQQTFDHIDGYISYLDGESELVSDSAIAGAVQMTLDAGAWVVPTMVLWETVLGVTDLEWGRNLPELQYMPRSVVEGWIESLRGRQQRAGFDRQAALNHVQNRMRLLRELNDAGAHILMGTDAPQMFSVPGFSVHHEMERMVEAGMTPYEVYRTGSVMIGRYLGDHDAVGTITEGAQADLVLVDANPLEDVAHVKEPAGVMVRGRWLSEEDIQSRLSEIAGMYASED
ncbi:MAG TPA: amidohydrolase family protein [Rhodothermales bacterium]|nr:amidohydrolase family protein [Rhodothermales bacterium]